MKEEGNKMIELIKAIFIFSYSLFAWGFVFFKYYKWFIPKSFSAPEICYMEAVGIMMFTVFFSKTAKRKFKDDLYEDTESDVFFTRIIAPWIALILGYLIHLIV